MGLFGESSRLWRGKTLETAMHKAFSKALLFSNDKFQKMLMILMC